jgi:hypothetical protein
VSQQEIMLKARGLYTFQNNLSEVPEGALTVADNVVVDRNGVIEPRRGQKQYGSTFGSGDDRANQLMTYKNRILRHVLNETIQYDSDNAGDFESFAGEYQETETNLRLKSLEANGNFYFTTSEGIKVISALTAAQFTTATGYIYSAGAPEALDVTGIIDYTNAGFFINPNSPPAYSKVAYEVTWARRDANDNLVEGAPSSRLVLTNYSPTLSGTVQLTFAIPSEIPSDDTRYFYRIYRTQVVGAATLADLDEVDPGQEFNLVIEDYPSSAQLIDRSVEVEDVTPDDFRAGGSLLYTNPVSGEGILQANFPPVLAKDIALFQNSVFYANTQTSQSLDITLLGVSLLTSGTSSITINGATTNTYIFRGEKEITDFTFDTQANTTDGGYFLLNAASNVRKYFVWFDKTGTTPEPSAIDTVDRLGIRVNISAAVTANDVADAVEAALNTDTIDFDAVAIGPVVTVTNLDNGATDDAENGLTPVGGVFAILVTTQGSGEGDPETTEFTFDTFANTTDGSYFLLNTAFDLNEYFVWFDKTGSTPAPAGLDTVGRTGVQVNVVGDVTAADIAASVEAALSALNKFNTSVLGAVVTVENVTNGPTTNAVAGLVPPGGAFAINITLQGELYTLLSDAPSPAQSIDITAKALVNAINNNPNETVNAFYQSSPDDVPGLILLKGRALTTASFYLTANSTNTGSQFSPAIPTSGNSVISENQIEPNALYYSKFQQPEAVPIVNKFNVGPKDKAILRILPLRDCLFVLKEDGIYRVTGQNAQFSLDPFDNTTILTAPDSAVVLNNQIYMLSSQGVATVSDTGVSVISRPIENILDRITSASFDYQLTTFGVSYESDRAYLLWTVTTTTDDVATQCFRFNTFTNSWTRFPISKTCGIVKFDDDKLYLGAGDENFIEQERKDFLRTDYSDREYPLSIGVNAIDGLEVTLSSSSDVEIGDVLLQVQYLSIYRFNQLLKMLDYDFNTTFKDYFSTLGLSAGANLRNAVDALAAKLDTDAGVANATFVASLGGGVTPANIQADYNIIVNLLNTASSTHIKNYQSSTGTTTVEALVIGKVKNSNTVILKFESPLVEGDVTSFRGIKTLIVWAPQTFGDPSMYKQVNEGTFLFENTVFYTATVSYASDLSQDFEETDFNESGLGDWGFFNWDDQNWGGEGSQVPVRTYIPRYKQRCRFIKPRFEHLIAREKYSLFGLSLSYRAFSNRAYRE